LLVKLSRGLFEVFGYRVTPHLGKPSVAMHSLL